MKKKVLIVSILVLGIVTLFIGYRYYITRADYDSIPYFIRKHYKYIECKEETGKRTDLDDKNTNKNTTENSKEYSKIEFDEEHLEELLDEYSDEDFLEKPLDEYSDEDFLEKPLDEYSNEEKSIILDYVEMAIVDKEIDKCMDKYSKYSQNKKKEVFLDLLYDLAENGTKKAPYSLIRKESICCGEDCITFQYSCDVLGGIMLKDFGSSPCDYIN